MDIIDRKLLKKIQSPFPLFDRPFKQLWEDVSITEQEVLNRLTELKRTDRLLKNIATIHHPRRAERPLVPDFIPSPPAGRQVSQRC